MEDLDTARVVPGCSDEILRTLEAFGLCWDGEVEYQSRRTAAYAEALESLRARNLTFECSCSRRELTHNSDTGYLGTCRAGPTSRGPTATRFKIEPSAVVDFEDRVQGTCRYELRALGDPIIRRRDGAFAYQLAVVVDDAAQGVSDIVRGADLLESTAWQLQIQQALRLPRPLYGHLPLVVESKRGKLAKSRRSLAIEPALASSQLSEALCLLRHNPPPEAQQAPPAVLLEWAIGQWNLDRFHGMREFAVGTQISLV
jgi:glutamyl-Q tRNA(Asp) synthetase